MIEWAIACVSSVLTESPSQYPATFIHIWFMLNKNERITLITQCLYLLSSYCAQLKSYMLAELLILLSSFLRLNGALKLIRIKSCDGISASEKQHSPVCLYSHTHTHTHTPGPSPQKQRSFCQELTVAVCLRMVRDWHWELGECFSHGAVCVKACFQYAKCVRARGRAGEVRRAYSWYFVRVRWVIVM